MKMNLIEMEGFLHGKGIPGDLKVNESNASYLVRKFAEMEAKCAALAAESLATNDRLQKLIQIISNADNDYCMCGDAMKSHVHGGCGHPTGMFDYHYNQWLESDKETPATDAFLAEVRACAVGEACLKISNAIVNCYQDEQIGLDAAATICGDFAAQLRQDVYTENPSMLSSEDCQAFVQAFTKGAAS